jgi:hypothetical protein
MLIYLLVGLLICALFAYQIADQKRAGSQGFWLGLFLGPAGVIAAGFMDSRAQCPQCGGRLNDTKDKQFNICPECRADQVSVRKCHTSANVASTCRSEPKRQDDDPVGNFRHLLHTE